MSEAWVRPRRHRQRGWVGIVPSMRLGPSRNAVVAIGPQKTVSTLFGSDFAVIHRPPHGHTGKSFEFARSSPSSPHRTISPTRPPPDSSGVVASWQTRTI